MGREKARENEASVKIGPESEPFSREKMMLNHDLEVQMSFETSQQDWMKKVCEVYFNWINASEWRTSFVLGYRECFFKIFLNVLVYFFHCKSSKRLKSSGKMILSSEWVTKDEKIDDRAPNWTREIDVPLTWRRLRRRLSWKRYNLMPFQGEIGFGKLGILWLYSMPGLF